MGLYESALLFHNQSLRLKETLGDREGVADSYTNIGNVYYHTRNYEQSLTNYFNAHDIHKKNENLQAVASVLNNIGDSYRHLKKYDKALNSYNEALDIQEKIGNQKIIANTLHHIGNFYYHLNIYDKAQEFYSKALHIRTDIGNKNDIAASRFNIATVHRDLGNYEDALKYYTVALELRKDTKNKVAEALTYSAIAGVYKLVKQFSKAIEYYEKALSMQQEIGSKPDIATLYERIGITYKDAEEYEHAEEFYNKALTIYTKLEHKKAVARITHYIGNLYREQKKYDIAYTHYSAALKIQDTIQDKTGMAYTYHNIAELFMSQQQPQKAVEQYENALRLAREINDRNLIQKIAHTLYAYYKNEGDFEKSLSFFELFNTTKEDIAQDKNLQRIAELEFESNIKLLEQINENQELKLREEHTKRQQQTILLIIVIIVAILIFGLSILLFRQFSQKKIAFNLLSENRKKLEKAYHSLEETHKLLQEKNEKITDSISYATRIQQAILPSDKTIETIFPKHFIFYLPRDIVSGDFYWFTEQSGYAFIAAIDCTGHGIPGAFMSMIGNTLLNQIVNEQHIIEPAEILNRLDKEIIATLKQNEKDNSQEDGLSISLIRYSPTQNELLFAGAGQKAVCVSDDDIKKYNSTLFSIGGMHTIKMSKNHSFSQTIIPVKKGMRLFLYSDGYIDQFGGLNDSRFSSKRFYTLLKSTHQLDMSEQHTELSKQFDEWKDEKIQIDDVIVIGIEF